MRTLRSLGVFMAAALMSACSSAPVTAYRLASEPGPVEQTAPLTISVRRISIPSYLDQGSIPRPVNRYVAGSFPNAIWAGPFADTLQTTMVEDLAQRLKNATVIDSNGSIETPSDLQIEINVLRFDPTATGDVELTVQAALNAGADHRLLGLQTIRRTLPAGATASDIVAAMSALWASAADQIAASVVSARAT
ncbi:MAG TPA: PqiC family protein [Acidocella sp.]|jgi:uncharacterized lipoprotein YmbA|uniref:PqiC family protein n=1 Tax=Acidocella sp. TaxID=50710 RepID=UPI002BA8CB89|nr:PqiC family protein [Acidocella sp.]HVE22381.1 PqiC family protein [Acidocella sp.]